MSASPTATSSKQAPTMQPQADLNTLPPSPTLSDEERVKLAVVLDSIDPCQVMAVQVATPALPTPTTLRQAVKDTSQTILSLKTLVNLACSSLLATGPRDPAHPCAEFRRIALALLDELNNRNQPKLNVKRENTESDISPRPTKKFMLHRGIGNVDLFSSAAELSRQDLVTLAQSQDTDIIALTSSTKPSFTELEGSQATLGAANPRLPNFGSPFAETQAHNPSPVTFLYYDPFQSFAPSFDSSLATLGSAESVKHTRSELKRQEWEDELMRYDLDSFEEPGDKERDSVKQDTTARSHPLTLSIQEQQMLEDVGVDSKSLTESAQENDRQAATSEQLAVNGRLLLRLIKASRARLKFGGGTEPTSQREQQDASQLVSALSELLGLRPRPPPPSNNIAIDDVSRKAHERALSIIPPRQAIRSTTARIVESLSRDPVYYGTLEEGNIVAVKGSDMEKAHNQQ
ncbi:hypothetical protein OIO90_002756 [Microbotryomycetes sp. JL221]|nr:hypothetical protein OIO90_002756 [Microbotryomycetes sp. JL221]